MTQPNRLREGGRAINRAKPLAFRFDGAAYMGFDGDTLASALLANGVRMVGRSYKYHRPRGIFSAGPEEPNAIVTLGEGARLEPNTRATLAELRDGGIVRSQNNWPSLGFDLGAAASLAWRILPAGFYYKTFMWPPKLWMFYERLIRRAASTACVPPMADPDSYAHRYAHCDVLVVGAGPAGLSAARMAAESGARVILADAQSSPGGFLLSDDSVVDDSPGDEWAKRIVDEFRQKENAVYLPRTTVQGFYDYNYFTAVERVAENSGAPRNCPRERLWKIRAKRTVLACGAIERPPVFADNDRPGVMTANAVQIYLRRYAVLPGKNMVFFTNNDSAYAVAIACLEAGAQVEIADARPPGGGWAKRARDAGITVNHNCAVAGVRSARGVSAVQIAELSADGKSLVSRPRLVECDSLAVSGGWTPTVHLFSQGRGRLKFDDSIGAFVPAESAAINPCFAAGACSGVFALDRCLRDGASAGEKAAMELGFSPPQNFPPSHSDAPPEESPARILSLIPTIHPVGRGGRKHFVDLMNDVTAADILLAEREGYDSAEHMKRYTAAGFGTDQGKTGNINALGILAEARGKSIPEIGHTTFRPHFTPTAFGVVAGMERGELFRQIRKTPMHSSHKNRGAIFEDVGDWKRPRYYPQTAGESMDDAVAHECKIVREKVGVMDASTLGKIDVQGKDAAAFLDIIYTNKMSALKIGRCRYGLMLNEHGMIFDDGIAARLGENHFHLTTTTGGAARVLQWLEEWLQTEWPHLQVFCASVTEQWAVAAVGGPNARQLICAVCGLADSDLPPFMGIRECEINGIPSRIFRVSFSGESAFEINIPMRWGLHLWETLLEKGREFGIAPYGTEAMHVLRAEKGFIIVGQDTDGTATPQDMGLDWMMKKDGDFLGKRSHSRTDITREGRKQFVGLLSENPQMPIPEGAHLVGKVDSPPMDILGHVTSSYMSPTLGRAIALAMIKDGRNRMGETLSVPLADGRILRATVTDPVFYDKEGERIRG